MSQYAQYKLKAGMMAHTFGEPLFEDINAVALKKRLKFLCEV